MDKNNKITLAVILAVVVLLAGYFVINSPGTTGPGAGGAEENLVQNVEMPEFQPTRGTFSYPGMFQLEEDAEAEYAYSDEYFTLDSSLYNPSLATMSLCLELSSWSSYETDVWEEKSRNAEALLTEIGFEDYAQNEFWQEKPSVKSVGAVAAHKHLEDATLIALAVRGGGYYSEWGSNVTVGAEGEHTGFAEGRDHVIHFLEQYIQDCGITGRVKLWVVGYSRGGAIANMTAGYLNQNGLSGEAKLAFEDLYCYAFAPPQGALEESVGEDSKHANIHNVINANDLVPLVAPGDWSFDRYNTTSHLLPTVTTVHFETALSNMLVEYGEILQGVALEDSSVAEYNVPEYAKKMEVSVDPLHFLPSGEPFVTIEMVDDTRQTQSEMLNAFISAYAKNVEDRDHYFASLETDMIRLLDDLLGYESEMDFEEFLDSFTSIVAETPYENLQYVLEPIFQFEFVPVEECIDEVVDRLYEVVPQPEGYEDLYGTAAAMVQIMGSMVLNDTEELLDILLAFLGSEMMQAHYPEVMLAWVRSGDPHYTESPFVMRVPETVRVVRVNCPVQVQIYDRQNVLVASSMDDVCTTNNGVVGCAINEDGEIILHLPADEEYRVVITAVGDGEVNLTLSEYNVVHGCVTRVQNYPDVAIINGDVLTLELPNLTAKEYTDEEKQGSTAEYRFLGADGKKIPCAREDRGADVKFFEVNLDKDAPYGLVEGGGLYLDGSFALAEAKPMAGSTFDGWYVGETKVSDEPTYRFAVTENLDLVAHFTETPLHEIFFEVTGQGTVANVKKAYSTDSQVQLSAEAAEGYVFEGWTTTVGTIEDETQPETILTVGEDSAVVIAAFRQEEQGEVCKKCKEVLEEGETHVATCGTAEHYTCDGRFHIKASCGNEKHYACDSVTHMKAACGTKDHYTCDGNDHKKADCGKTGHYVCDEKTHKKASCGKSTHYTCDGDDHSKASCGKSGHYDCDNKKHTKTDCGISGHYNCDSKTHTEATCGTSGHYRCDGKVHTKGVCGTAGHYTCDGINHRKAYCGIKGHYNCDGREHERGSCGVKGHYLCEGGEHEMAACGVSGHAVCDGAEHRTASCGTKGHYACDNRLHIGASCRKIGHYACDDTMKHEAASCGIAGHYTCDGKTHTSVSCGMEGHYSCDGLSHKAAVCGTAGHYGCDGLKHEAAACGTSGHYGCDGLRHEVAFCGKQGHYTCSGEIHGAASCGTAGHYVCDGLVHGAASCGTAGHNSCDGLSHEAGTCGTAGHYGCDGGFHGVPGCGTVGHYGCDGLTHTASPCGLTGHYSCDGLSHEAAVCGVAGHYSCDGAPHGEVTLQDPTFQALKDALTGCCTVIHVTTSLDNQLVISENLTIPAGKTLNLVGAKVQIASGVILNNNGTVTIDSLSTLTNYGSITGTPKSSFQNNGTFDNQNPGFDPSTFPFTNNGTYVDVRNDQLYLLVTDAQNLVMDWDTMTNMLGVGSNNGLGWKSNYTYTVHGTQPALTETYTGENLQNISEENLNLTWDLNGRTVSLTNSINLEGAKSKLTIIDHSAEQKGVLKSSDLVIRIYTNDATLVVEHVDIQSGGAHAIGFGGNNHKLRFVSANVMNSVGDALASLAGIPAYTTIEMENTLISGGTTGYGLYYYYFENLEGAKNLSLTIDGAVYNYTSLQTYEMAANALHGIKGGKGDIYFPVY